jgi:hypothetical protein
MHLGLGVRPLAQPAIHDENECGHHEVDGAFEVEVPG